MKITSVDGSYGEGGGQILRSAISLSAITEKPIDVKNIRAKRPNPGLQAQQLWAIKAVASLCSASVEGLHMGSTNIRFIPQKINSENLRLDIGTAGSITLLLQTIIPVATFSEKNIDLRIIGGTDVKWSPTINYFDDVVLPAFRAIGINCEINVLNRGYYPKGGGVVDVSISNSDGLRALKLIDLPANVLPKIKSVCSKLPLSVAERQANTALSLLRSKGIKVDSTRVEEYNSISPGTSISITSVKENGPFLGGDAVGEVGKPAEAIGKKAAEMFLQEATSGATVDSHLGDMLITPLALLNKESIYRISKVTSHLVTNLQVAETIVGCKYEINEETNGTALVKLRGGNLL